MTLGEDWSYLSDYELRKKRTTICITCSHFRYTTDAYYRTLLICPFLVKLTPQGDHLIKGCQHWKKDVRVLQLKLLDKKFENNFPIFKNW